MKDIISNLITLSTPVRTDIQLNQDIIGRINHLQILNSRKDFVQQVGYIDNNEYAGAILAAIFTAFFGLIPLLFGTLGMHEFDSAYNIDITDYIKKDSTSPDYVDNIYDIVNKKIFNPLINNKAFDKWHQSTRSIHLIENILKILFSLLYPILKMTKHLLKVKKCQHFLLLMIIKIYFSNT